MKNALHRSLTPLALVAALTLSACGGDEASFEDTPTQQSTAQEESDAAEDAAEDADTDAAEDPAEQADADSTEDDVTAQSAAAAGIDLTDLGEPIGTATIPAVISDDPDATMDFSLYELRRDGETVIATYSVLVHSDTTDARWIYEYLGAQSWFPFLVDPVNLNRHDVLGSAGQWVMTDSQGARFRPGQTLYAMAVFAAPPEDVTTMTAQIVEGAPALTEVPIQ